MWLPGEADYTGDVVERLENFTTNCGKPSIHFFGHTHAYSRGQSRDHNHLWVNVAVSGGNIDYWGEFTNVDYDEYIVSQDEYGFVMVEVTAGENPQFVLKRLSFGDQYNPGGTTETDLMTIRMNNIPPVAPIPLFPIVSDTVSPFCFTMQADGFTDPDDDGFGAAHWQISADSINFTAPVFESWKQYENWFQEVDLQAGDDLTNEEATNLQGGHPYWWRVRYRDRSMEWSPWSATTRFNTRALDSLTSNMIVNPGAETGINGWTATTGVIESLNPLECAGVNPYQGAKYFAIGALCVEFPFASAYQDMNIASHASLIDANEVLVNYGAYLADYANTDEPSLALQFLNSNGQVISGTDTIRHRQTEWTLKQAMIAVPSGTRIIRYIIMGTRFSGVDNDSYADNIFCKLFTGDLDCSTYNAPGPANGRIYVDVNGIGTPDGKSWTTAYRTLGHALLQSNADNNIQEIWMADGIYPVTSNAIRDTSFKMTRAVDIYGGFAGFESSITQRNIVEHITILSGEIADTNLITDNGYHVLEITGTLDTVILDGLHLCCGYADGPSDAFGGGMFVSMSNRKPVKLIQCSIDGNYAIQGSSIYNQGKMIIDGTVITNEVIDGVTGCSILNEGEFAIMSLDNSNIIQQCNSCTEAIKNTNGAILNVSATVSIEKE